MCLLTQAYSVCIFKYYVVINFRAEVCELHDLLQSKKPLAVPSSQSTGRDFYDESYKLKSLEIEVCILIRPS